MTGQYVSSYASSNVGLFRVTQMQQIAAVSLSCLVLPAVSLPDLTSAIIVKKGSIKFSMVSQ